MNKPNKSNQNQNERREFKPCAQQEVAGFITKIQNSSLFMRKGYIPVTDDSHFERFVYSYNDTGEKISIVYDTKAKKLSYEAKSHIAKILDELFFNKNRVQSAGCRAQNNMGGTLPPAVGVANTSDPPPSNSHAKEKTKAVGDAHCAPSHSNLPTAENANTVRADIDRRQNSLLVEGWQAKSDGAVTPPPAFALAHQKLTISDKLKEKSTHGRTVQLKNSTKLQNNKKPILQPNQPKIPDVIAGKNKPVVAVNDRPHSSRSGGTLLPTLDIYNSNHLSGKLPAIVNVQPVGGAYCAPRPSKSQAIESLSQPQKVIDKKPEIPAQFTKQQHTDAVKRLKKLIPNAFDFLSEQAKTDLTIGLIDIFNDRTRLSDYSVLLVPPYRGLERLIFGLQAAQGIEVKMIGQAFEKDDKGSYLLKSGYRKKINSIVYNEVLSALYTEYFVERHSCTHSDNTDTAYSRAVTDLQSARSKFNKLLEIIDYNCKKLKEIGFSV